MSLTAMRVVAFTMLYVILFAVVSAAALWFRMRRMSARIQGDYIEMFSIPLWWWGLLVGPPLLLFSFWIWQHLGRE